jgi:hypothetical protein
MDRRSFFRTMVGGVAAAAAVRTWPFRVYSFPTDIVFPTVSPLFDQISAATLAELRADLLIDNFFVDTPFLKKLKEGIHKFPKGDPMRTPFNYESA